MIERDPRWRNVEFKFPALRLHLRAGPSAPSQTLILPRSLHSHCRIGMPFIPCGDRWLRLGIVDGVLAGQLCSLDNSEQGESAASALVDLGTNAHPSACGSWPLLLLRIPHEFFLSRVIFVAVLHCSDRRRCKAASNFARSVCAVQL
jgi:hypothetical protein